MTIHSNSKALMTTKYSTPSTFVLTALSASLMLMSNSAFAVNAITAMDVTKVSPNLTQLRLDFEEQPSLPAAYQLENPSRLVLDFNEIHNQLPSRSAKFNQGVVKEVNALSDESTTRLIVGLDSPSSSANTYATQVEGNALYLNIMPQTANINNYSVDIAPLVDGQNTGDDLPAAQPIVTESENLAAQQSQTAPKDTMVVKVNPLLNPQASAAVTQQYSYDGLSAVTYNGSAQGGGDIKITLTNEDVPVDLQRQGNKLVVRMTGATVPRNLIRRINAGDGLVASVDATNQNQNGVVTVNMAQDFEYQAYQTGNQ